ncbi:MAG: hypothetical protein ACREMH_01045 [Gemmatimonadales bacterium]
MTRISGFTIARNAVKLCFPLQASITSLPRERGLRGAGDRPA